LYYFFKFYNAKMGRSYKLYVSKIQLDVFKIPLEEGGAIFDLLCTGVNGEQFIIEVQRSKQDNFKKRAIFYTSRLISEQAPRGKRSAWDYAVREVYLVALLDGFSLEDMPPAAYTLLHRSPRPGAYGKGHIPGSR
jgi:hypothetical protein